MKPLASDDILDDYVQLDGACRDLIGEGRACAGGPLPRFVKQYADLRTVLREG